MNRKELLLRTAALFLTVLMLLPVAVGCKPNTPKDGTDTTNGANAETTNTPLVPPTPGIVNIYENGLSLTASSDTYIQEENSNPNAADKMLKLYTSGRYWDCLPILRFELSSLSSHDVSSFDNIYLMLYVLSVPTDTKIGTELCVYTFDNNIDISSAVWSDFTSEKSFVPSDKIATYKIDPTVLESYIRIDITQAVRDKLSAGGGTLTLALDDGLKKSMNYCFSSVECDDADNAPMLVFGELSQKIKADADLTDAADGKINISVSARLAQTGVPFKLTFYSDDGKVTYSNETLADLTFGKNNVLLTYPKEKYQGKFKISYLADDKENVIAEVLAEENMTEYCIDYLEKLKAENSGKAVEQTGISKAKYAEVIATCLSQYNKVTPIEKMTPANVDSTLQSYSRVVCSMAVLCADGDVTRFASIDSGLYSDHAKFVALYNKMMTTACNALPTYAGKDVMNFSGKEIILAYELTREKTDAATLALWGEKLSAVTDSYYSHATKTTNRNVYVMGGEQLRFKNGFSTSTNLIDSSWERQKTHFNALGMYLDNYSSTPEHNPVLYDLTTRVQLQLVPGGGYNGKYLDEMNTVLRNGGLVTLFTQSAAYELSYGGRSNQYLFNEALISSNCEYEAAYYASVGDDYTAGVYKRAAHLAITAISRWLDAGKHIKNFYADSTVGTEGYGNFDKYMATMSSFLAIGYYFADDSIKEELCPAECGGYVFSEYGNFNYIIANAGGYSIQIVTSADKHYDSNGLGRIHKVGVPTELGISSSFTATPTYTADKNAKSADLTADIAFADARGNIVRLAAQSGYTNSLTVTERTRDRVCFTLVYSGGTLSSVGKITENYVLSADGLTVTARLESNTADKVYFTVPALVASGDTAEALKPQTSVSGGTLTVSDSNNSYTVVSDGAEITLSDEIYANRNGRYKIALFSKAGNEITLSFKLS